MNESPQDEDRRYDIFRGPPCAKKPEADFSARYRDASRREEIPGQVKHSGKEEYPWPEMKGDEDAIYKHQYGRSRNEIRKEPQKNKRDKPQEQFMSQGPVGRDPLSARRFQLVGQGCGRHAVNDLDGMHI